MNNKITIQNICIAALMIAICTIGRILCASLPNIQPMTAFIILSAIFFTPFVSIGICIGSILMTSILFGFGIWVPFQMVAYVVICLVCILFKSKCNHHIVVVIIGIAAAFIYGFITNLSMLFFVNSGFLLVWVSGLMFDVYHAIGNVAFLFILYRPFKTILNYTKGE